MDSISLKSQKKQRFIAFILVNTIQYPCTLKSNIYQSNKQWTPSFFHLHTNLVLGHILIHSVDKIHVLVVTVELICFLIFSIISFIFVPTPNKFLRYQRFRKSYVKRPDVVNLPHKLHCFFTRCACAVHCGYVPFFCSCLSPMLVRLRNLFLLSTPTARMLLFPGWVSRQKDVKQLSINILKLTVGVKHYKPQRNVFS